MKLCPHCLTHGWKSPLKNLNPIGAILQRLKCIYCGWEERIYADNKNRVG